MMITRKIRLLLFVCFLFIAGFSQKSHYSFKPDQAEKGAEILLTRADTAYLAARYNVALDYASEALEVFRVTGNKKRQLYCITRLGDICRAAEIRPKSYKFLREAIRLAQDIGDSSGLALAYNNYAATWYEDDIRSVSYTHLTLPTNREV